MSGILFFIFASCELLMLLVACFDLIFQYEENNCKWQLLYILSKIFSQPDSQHD